MNKISGIVFTLFVLYHIQPLNGTFDVKGSVECTYHEVPGPVHQQFGNLVQQRVVVSLDGKCKPYIEE